MSRSFSRSGNRDPYCGVFPITVYRDAEIIRTAKRIGKECGIPAEVKKIGGSHYLYRSTTRWDREKRKRVKVSEYIGRIEGNGLVERNRRSIFEFGNSELLITMAEPIMRDPRGNSSGRICVLHRICKMKRIDFYSLQIVHSDFKYRPEMSKA